MTGSRATGPFSGWKTSVWQSPVAKSAAPWAIPREMAAQPRAKPSTTPTPVDSGLHTEGLGRKQGVPSAESKISPVSARAEFPGTSRLSTQRSSLFYCCFVTAAGADLMQLDDVAEGVSHKYLIGILSD